MTHTVDTHGPAVRLKTGGILMLLAGLFLFCPSSQAQSPVTEEFRGVWRIGSGGLKGVYYPVARLIAEGLTAPPEKTHEPSRGVPGLIAVAQTSAGSVANVQGLARGELEMALVQADVAAQAWRNEGVFAGETGAGSIQAVASLYAEKLQLVVRRDAGIHHIADLRGKHVSIDETGSGTLAVMRLVLQAYQITEADFFPVYLKPEFTIERIRTGGLQGVTIMAGAPAAAVEHIMDVGITLVPIEADIAARISAHTPYLTPDFIPAGTYPDVPETPTLAVYALLVVRADANPHLVYQITRALWSDTMQALFRQGPERARDITLATARQGLSIPLHAGAEQFYAEQAQP